MNRMSEPATNPRIDFNALFENALDAGVIVDARHQVLRTNGSFERLFGWSAEEACGRHLDDLIVPPEFRAEAAEFNRQAIAHGALSREATRSRKDGGRVSVAVLASTIKGVAGDQLTYVQYRDITAQKRAEEQIRASEAQLRATFDHAPVGLALVTPETHVVRCNRALADLLGFTQQDLIGRRLTDLAHPDDIETIERRRQLLLSGKLDTSTLERRYRHKDDYYVWVRGTYSLIRSSDREPLHFIAVLEDFTESRKTHLRREAALGMFKSLIENMRDGILVESRQRSVLAVNQSLLDIFALPGGADSFVGTDYPATLRKSAHLVEEPEEFVALIQHRIDDARPAMDSVRFKDGRQFERDYAPIFDNAGNITGHMWDYHDLTLTLRLQEQLRQSQKMEAVGRLAGGIAHDFNNLLTVLQGHASMLLDDVALSESAQDDVREILQASSKAANLIRQLLAYSRQQLLKPTILDLGEVVQELERSLLRMIREDIALEVIVDPQTPPVRADRTQIEQVILNLAVNARDAMPMGGNMLIRTTLAQLTEESVEFEFTIPPGDYAVLSVRDSGLGIADHVLPRIFDPFFTTKEQGKGTGLGLATVYGIVKQSGGYIVVHSTPSSGSEFQIYLPRATS